MHHYFKNQLELKRLPYLEVKQVLFTYFMCQL